MQVRPGSQEEQVGRLILAAVLVMFLPVLPFGNFLIWPFVILTTWFHEMGHGLTALLTGNRFDELVIFANGSGYASSRTALDSSGLERALIAMGGPLGPSVVGAVLILASSARRYWKPALLALAGALLLSTLIWVRSTVGFIVLPAIAALLAYIALRGSRNWQLFALQFLGVLAAMSMFNDLDYLFSEVAVIGGEAMLSDTGAIEAELLLPHWIWAILLIAFSGVMIGTSLRYALNHEGHR
ncbi:M50 family metallopeptidase [Aurantiacibacter poecillastricola]|uniref:M50 family metallopeptidase n=1 Tax=Aurantiacibacter poecillastricola TaxID=3064385 RepID=UPI00273ECD61|nr:M50 family metallopeptidase [Aurantiacibacter sp. 219JJ12-13]MDP5260795.1 M50 family metallopeptidase [Aurantiacibacter sp. 219JJ12-13]